MVLIYIGLRPPEELIFVFCCIIIFFLHFGLKLWDCAGAVEVRNQLAEVLRLELPGTLVFDYPTISALTKFILGLTSPTTQASQSKLPSDLHSVSHGPGSRSQASLIEIKSKIMGVLRDILGGDVQDDVPFSRLGMDSLAAAEIRNALSM